MAEPAAYRPFALLAFGTSVLAATPIGVWQLAALHAGAPPVARHWVLAHASLQIVGFFGTLIVGVAQHLLPRFTGRPVAATPRFSWLGAALAVAIGLRLAGAAVPSAGAALVGAALQAAAFAGFAGWVWRTLDPPPLRLLRWHLTLGAAWFALACALEAIARVSAAVTDAGAPDPGIVRATHAMALLGGVLGWVSGVLLRAGPMFVAGWRVPAPLARLMPWALGAATVVTALGEGLGPRITGGALIARTGELIALGTLSALVLAAGALRRGGRALPMLSRSPAEARIFRLAVACAVAATAGALAATLLAARGLAWPLLDDAVRHLLTVGVLASVAVAMAFRLVPVIEGRALPWPAMRDLAFWMLAGAAGLRSLQVSIGLGWEVARPLVALSGVLAWVALAAVFATLIAVALAQRASSSR